LTLETVEKDAPLQKVTTRGFALKYGKATKWALLLATTKRIYPSSAAIMPHSTGAPTPQPCETKLLAATSSAVPVFAVQLE
jgi:hypothetical protein